MVHRGACSADNDSGDGAGVLLGIPQSFYSGRLREEQGLELPSKGQYASGIMFLDPKTAEACRAEFCKLAASVGLSVLCWRNVPTDNSCLGAVAKASEPFLMQVRLQRHLNPLNPLSVRPAGKITFGPEGPQPFAGARKNPPVGGLNFLVI